MKSQGVTFNFDKRYQRPVSYTITINGDQDQYLTMIKSLLSLIRNVNEDMLSHDQICDVCDLITDMLPTEDQIIINNTNDKAV